MPGAKYRQAADESGMRVLGALVLVLLLGSGCGSFLIGLGLLIECGPMPMSADDCQPKKK